MHIKVTLQILYSFVIIHVYINRKMKSILKIWRYIWLISQRDKQVQTWCYSEQAGVTSSYQGQATSVSWGNR